MYGSILQDIAEAQHAELTREADGRGVLPRHAGVERSGRSDGALGSDRR